MRYVNFSSGIAASLAIMVAASPAAFAQGANQTSCVQMQDQVKTALDGNAAAPSYEQARREQTTGLQYCQHGFYDNGVAHYAEALKLLGASKG